MEPSSFIVRRTLRANTARGFTLVEMLVVLAIIATITMMTLFGQSTFNRSILLTDTAYTVALSLREAQSSGLSSRRFGGVQNAGYGGHFAMNAISAYLLFADIGGTGPLANCPAGTALPAGHPERKPGNCRYEAGTDGIVRPYSFSNKFSISHLCGTASSGGTRYCSNTSPALTSLDVVFLRSNTTDTIMTGNTGSTIALSSVEIYLRANDGGDTRGICVSQVGQISVVHDTCP